jgi:NAD(P)H-dependent FMN reductase
MKVGILLASIREGRTSHKVAYYLSDLLRANGCEVDFLDLKETMLPLYDGSAAQDALPEAARLLEFVRGNQGFVLVFPEYNHNVAPPLLNALNYLEHRELMHKPVGLVCVSVGIGGGRAILIGRGSIPTQGAVIVPTAVNVTNVETTFPDHTTCTNPKTQEFIRLMLQEVVSYADRLTGVVEECGEGGHILAANVHIN